MSEPLTNLEYLKSTPELYRGSGRVSNPSRLFISCSDMFKSIVLFEISRLIMSPSLHIDIGPLSKLSGATWPIHKPVVPPENLPSVIYKTSLPSPAPLIAAVI